MEHNSIKKGDQIMYLYIGIDGKMVFQSRHEPLTEDLKSIDDGQNILLYKLGSFFKLNSKGEAEPVPIGYIEKAEGIEWTTLKKAPE